MLRVGTLIVIVNIVALQFRYLEKLQINNTILSFQFLVVFNVFIFIGYNLLINYKQLLGVNFYISIQHHLKTV